MSAVFDDIVAQSGSHHRVELYKSSLRLLVQTIHDGFTHLVLHLQRQVLFYVALEGELLIQQRPMIIIDLLHVLLLSASINFVLLDVHFGVFQVREKTRVFFNGVLDGVHPLRLIDQFAFGKGYAWAVVVYFVEVLVQLPLEHLRSLRDCSSNVLVIVNRALVVLLDELFQLLLLLL